MLQRLTGNDKFVNRCLEERDFGEIVEVGLLHEIFNTVRAKTQIAGLDEVRPPIP